MDIRELQPWWAGKLKAENVENGVLCSKRLNNYTFKTCKILFTLLIGDTQTNLQHAITNPSLSPPSPPVQVLEQWKINKMIYLTLHVKFADFRAFSDGGEKNVDLIVKTSCKNSIILACTMWSMPGLKKEIKIQRRQILHLHSGLLALENAANATGSPCRNIISKQPNSIYAVSHHKYFLAGDKRLFLL